MLHLTVKVGEIVIIKGIGKIRILEKSGQRIKLGFETDKGPISIVSEGAAALPSEPRK